MTAYSNERLTASPACRREFAEEEIGGVRQHILITINTSQGEAGNVALRAFLAAMEAFLQDEELLLGIQACVCSDAAELLDKLTMGRSLDQEGDGS